MEAIRRGPLLRRLREMTVGADGSVVPAAGALVNFASNDYLGLASHDALREAAKRAIDQYGIGAGASRLVCGTMTPHLQLERRLAQFKGVEAALTFSSGYAAAHGVIGALATEGDVLIFDKLLHACFIDAARGSKAVVRVFPHNHLGKLESLLEWAQQEHPQGRVLIATESIFSMDGDRAPLRELVALKKRFGALLLVDEAHALGVAGSHGRGLAHECEVHREVDILMGTMSKALGVSGGYLAGRRSLIDLLINRARSFIFSTAQPPALAAAAHAALELLASDEGERLRLALWQNIRQMNAQLPPAPGGSSATRRAESAIFPWIVGDEASAVDVSARLAEAGFFAPAIRYPTVARGAARLRLTISARHRPEQIQALTKCLSGLAL
ncbi:MAG: 8-amino-7-oxononanoate synthase [Verrucomicrobia bacterium]|nr:8-amino-7-oxononanoate synthase [Verrucomicrobiota bacterium]